MEQTRQKRTDQSLRIHFAGVPSECAESGGTIVDLTLALPENPLKHPLDKYKTNNDGAWRAFEKYHFRVSYRVMEKEIRIVRFRHTSRSPLNY